MRVEVWTEHRYDTCPETPGAPSEPAQIVKSRLQQYSQCTYNVTLRRFRESLLSRNSNTYHIFVCACVRACFCPSAWACTSACVRVVLLIQHVTGLRQIVTSFVVPLASPNFSTLSHKRHDIWKKNLSSIKYVFILSTNVSKRFLNLRII